MEKKSCDKCIRWICAILFAAFAFCWLFFFQRDLLNAEINCAFAGNDSLCERLSDSLLIVSLLLTIVSLLLVIPGRIILRFKKGLYFFSSKRSGVFLRFFVVI